jgi:hypothetical protein
MTEYELPPQTQLQQASARPVSGEELETYGRSAACSFQGGSANSLNEAVVETIKRAGLSPEQVKRVVEFANTHAFLTEFKKEGEATKYVNFEHGPANPSEVIKDLNDGGGGTVFDRGTLDYDHEPEVHKTSSVRSLTKKNQLAMEKVASIENEADSILAGVFRSNEELIPYENPLQDVERALDKLSTARDAATADMSELEVALLDINRDLYHQVKQAALEGVPLGYVLQAWHEVLSPPAELVKSAFAIIGPRLCKDEVFTAEQVNDSLTKTAGARAVNEEHPIVKAFGAYCEANIKLAELRATRAEIEDGMSKLQTFRKLATQHMEQRA